MKQSQVPPGYTDIKSLANMKNNMREQQIGLIYEEAIEVLPNICSGGKKEIIDEEYENKIFNGMKFDSNN